MLKSLFKWRKPGAKGEGPINLETMIMAEISEVAKAEYKKLPPGEKTEIKNKFNSMDANEDGKISLEEFMKARSWTKTNAAEDFFHLLDRNDDGFLQFDEFKTLSYIEKSGRPFCEWCGHFIPGMFFTCPQCRLSPTNDDAPTSDLCVSCYYRHAKQFRHLHPVDEFVDNYYILLRLRENVKRQTPQASTSGAKKGRVKRAFQKTGKKAWQFLVCTGGSAVAAYFGS